jgi:5-(carboxyamino)imidazole ribonucleotide synthase
VEAARFLAERVPVYPPPSALEAAQDRLSEKHLFQKLDIATTEFQPISSREGLEPAVKQLGLPAVLKTCRMGYDGKGQWILRTGDDVARAKNELPAEKPESSPPAFILERFVSFNRELSVLAVRGRTGETAFYPMVENHHRGGILRLSLAPAPRLDAALQRTAEDAARKILESLQYVGVLAIEFFEHDGRLLANEMAPRVHNSGHWSIEGAVTSQFENHLRGVTGLPLGAPNALGCSAMLNLIGEVPDASEVLGIRDAHLHLYGKAARAGRKLGHITLRAASSEQLASRLAELPSFFHRPDFCLDAAFARPASSRA